MDNGPCFGAQTCPNQLVHTKFRSNQRDKHTLSALEAEVQLLERWCPDLVGYGPIPATSRQMIKVTKTSEEVASLSGR